MRRNSFDSPNTHYLHGPLLSDFIQDYCAARSIFFDPDILNAVFMQHGFSHSQLYSENEVIANIELARNEWHLDADVPLQTRN